MKKSKIKLFKLDESKDGKIIRLQSQLFTDRNVADFILDNGVLKYWGHGSNGFEKCDTPYEIVTNKADMMYQEL